jgi:hypothetical protein
MADGGATMIPQWVRNLEWPWLFWQVGIPILGQALISLLVVVAWKTINPGFMPMIGIILDVTPWALTFYALTLIGATLNGLWPKISDHGSLAVWLLVVAFFSALYTSLLVIRRHESTFVPGAAVYYVTLLLLFISVVLCHWGYAASKKTQ